LIDFEKAPDWIKIKPGDEMGGKADETDSNYCRETREDFIKAYLKA